MPEILPFRGILYDPKRVQAAKVLAPPYDVIDDAGRAALAARDPHNCVRLIMPEGEGAARYQNAARLFADWQKSGVLVRDDRPAVYRYHQVFTVPELGRTFRRRGFIAAVRLHDFSERVVLPHERTHKGPKQDRLELMKATHAHFSQIFTLYSDPAGNSDRLFRKIEDRAPDLDGVTDDGAQHLLWRVPDREIIGKLAHMMAPLKLYIADGHHRYETMLALRDLFRAAGPLATHSQAEYGTLFLSNMNDSGLVVLPTHRLLHSVPDLDPAKVMARAQPWFEITVIAGGARNPDAIRAGLIDRPHLRPGFAVVIAGDPDARVLSLRTDANLASAGILGSAALLDLDVTILHDLFLEHLAGVSRAAQDTKAHLDYLQDGARLRDRVAAGAPAQMGFIMTPTRVDQVRAVADAHEFMPQKSTYFFPKLASGIVINPIAPEDDLY
ncbi:MAG TPA: DUF1015 domain-containing protein [Kofleriaceae bacterium]|nr:DUF1015 domain-containing protein [Kofleriaceae bacterium]